MKKRLAVKKWKQWRELQEIASYVKPTTSQVKRYKMLVKDKIITEFVNRNEQSKLDRSGITSEEQWIGDQKVIDMY